MDFKTKLKYDPNKKIYRWIHPIGMTEAEKKEIRDWLDNGLKHKPAPEMAEKFLVELNQLLLTAGGFKKNIIKRNRSEATKRKKKILASLRKIIKEVESLHLIGLPPNSDDYLDDCDLDPPFRLKPFDMESHLEVIRSSREWRPLYEIKARLENELSEIKLGRPPERIYPSRQIMVKVIARLFAEYLEEPTYYRSGPFYNVIILSFNSLGLPLKAPDRLISAALKERKANN